MSEAARSDGLLADVRADGAAQERKRLLRMIEERVSAAGHSHKDAACRMAALWELRDLARAVERRGAQDEEGRQ